MQTIEAAPLLARVAQNDAAALDELFQIFYLDIARIARSRLSASGPQTLLDTGALVHEAYLRLRNVQGLRLKDREHFMAYAATTLRSVVVDFIRKRKAEQRGGDAQHVTLNTELAQSLGASDDEVLHVHEALNTLAQVDARMVKVVEMRYFAGMTELETAAALGVTDRTVRRDWEKARLLLAAMLKR
jgi:RNA polymerase sigma factor (TIGR02999 family)